MKCPKSFRTSIRWVGQCTAIAAIVVVALSMLAPAVSAAPCCQDCDEDLDLCMDLCRYECGSDQSCLFPCWDQCEEDHFACLSICRWCWELDARPSS
jgi:hypothetical protein